MGSFENLASIGPIPIWDGVVARAVDGERISLAVLELEAGTHVPEHSHDNEQLGMVISGSLEFRIGDELRLLTAGATWSIPPNVPHEVHAGPEGAVVVDVFGPARTEWRSLERRGAQPPRWP